MHVLILFIAIAIIISVLVATVIAFSKHWSMKKRLEISVGILATDSIIMLIMIVIKYV